MFKKPLNLNHDANATVEIKVEEETVEKISVSAMVVAKSFRNAALTVIAGLAAARVLEYHLTEGSKKSKNELKN